MCLLERLERKLVHGNTLVLRDAHDCRDYFVSSPEGHTGPNQIVGQIRGKKLWVERGLDAAEAARQAMREHFQRLLESMLEATERKALEEVQLRASQSRERFLAAAKFG